MKKRVISIFVVLLFCFVSLMTVKSENAGHTPPDKNDNKYENIENTNFTWGFKGPAFYNGLKITVYKKDGTYVGTKAFLNDQTEVNNLNNLKVMVRNDSRRLSTPKTTSGSWSDADSNYFQYLDYKDYFRTSIGLDEINKLLKTKGDEDIIKKLGATMYSEEELLNFVLVIEPAIRVQNVTTGTYYFGTYWEYQYLWETNDDFKFGLWNVIPDLGNSLQIAKDEISKQKTPTIWEFLNNNFKTFLNNLYSKNALGVAIVTLPREDPPEEYPKELPCETKITKGSCNTDFSIKEPTDKICVVNNGSYKETAVGDCGTIYCSEDITTDLDDFYKTFKPIITSGDYFKMNSVKLNITKTCYIVPNSTNICNDWQNNIKKENAGTIKLSLATNYTLVEDSNNSSFQIKCDSYSNGKCTKATATQHIEYVLAPNTNHYISMVDGTGTATGPGDMIIDLKGEHLTTPLMYATGKHQYKIDYSGVGILSNAIKRIKNTTVTLRDQNLVLNYFHTGSITSNALSYSCDYDVTKIPPCTPGDPDCPPSCTPGDPGCPNPCVCTAECCDDECNPISCPPPPEEFPPFIEYRPINLVEAFPGQSGIGRIPGRNWYGYVYDSNGNTINKPNGTPYTKEEYYINYNRGYSDYEVYHSEPLYVIKLDYQTLKEIREYNDKSGHDYNNATLTCINGENCISNFLRGNITGFNLNLITGGKCANSTTANFNNCTKRLGA